VCQQHKEESEIRELRGGIKNEEKRTNKRTLRNSLMEWNLIGNRGVNIHNKTSRCQV